MCDLIDEVFQLPFKGPMHIAPSPATPTQNIL